MTLEEKSIRDKTVSLLVACALPMTNLDSAVEEIESSDSKSLLFCDDFIEAANVIREMVYMAGAILAVVGRKLQFGGSDPVEIGE